LATPAYFSRFRVDAAHHRSAIVGGGRLLRRDRSHGQHDGQQRDGGLLAHQVYSP
jgi:hypothetical protein